MSDVCRYVYSEFGLLSDVFPRGCVIVGTCPAMSALCRDVFGDVVLVSGLDRRIRVSVGTCSSR